MRILKICTFILIILFILSVIVSFIELASRIKSDEGEEEIPSKNVKIGVINPSKNVIAEEFVIENDIVFEPITIDEPSEEAAEELNIYTSYENRFEHNIILTDEEAYRLAALVQAEADDLYDCRLAITSLFINRMMFYNTDFYSTLEAPGQFVTDWDTIAYAEPLQDSIDAVYDVLYHGCTIPPYVMFYKIEGYHNWGDQIGWGVIGTTYFSYSQWQREEIEQNYN